MGSISMSDNLKELKKKKTSNKIQFSFFGFRAAICFFHLYIQLLLLGLISNQTPLLFIY